MSAATSSPATVEEYSPIDRGDLGADWEELESYVHYLAQSAESLYVEEKPSIGWDPQTRDLAADLKGFVGRYQFRSGRIVKFVPKPTKLPGAALATMIKEVANWAMLQGAPFVSSLPRFLGGPFAPGTPHAFSGLVRAISKTILFGYVPPSLIRERRVGREPAGPVDVWRTLRKQLTGRPEVVSIRTRLEPDSLPLLLLFRFNAELARRLHQSVANMGVQFGLTLPFRTASQWGNEHWELARMGHGPTALDRALALDFEDPNTLRQVERSANTSELKELLHIWIAYRGGAIPEVSVQQDLFGLLGNALRPLSKLYELWCLRNIIAALEGLGVKWREPFPGLPDSIAGDLRDGGTITLHYNVTPHGSDFLDQVRQNVSPHHAPRPDFVLHVRMGAVQRTVILDAKYKLRGSIDAADLQRLAWYGLSFTASSDAMMRIGLLHLDPGGGEIKTVSIVRRDPHVTIYLIGLQPEEGKKHLTEFLAELVRQ